MPWRLAKRFKFSAAHRLDYLPAGHKCERLHGHNYTVEVVVSAFDLDSRGFAGVDYAELNELGAYIEQHLDHHNLNAVLNDARATTAENLARFFFLWCRSTF